MGKGLLLWLIGIQFQSSCCFGFLAFSISQRRTIAALFNRRMHNRSHVRFAPKPGIAPHHLDVRLVPIGDIG